MTLNLINKLTTWLPDLGIKINTAKSPHFTFDLRRKNCSPVYLNSTPIPEDDKVRYLGLHIQSAVKIHKAVSFKFKTQTSLSTSKFCSNVKNLNLLRKKINFANFGHTVYNYLTLQTKTIYKAFQFKYLRLITNSPSYVSKLTLHTDLKTPFIEYLHYSKFYSKIHNHTNPLVRKMFNKKKPIHDDICSVGIETFWTALRGLLIGNNS